MEFSQFSLTVDNVVRLRSDNLTFWPKTPKTGQILIKKVQKVRLLSLKSDFHEPTSAIFSKCILKKFYALSNRLAWICFGMWSAYFLVLVFRNVLEVFETCAKDSSRQRYHRAYNNTQKYLGQSQKGSNFDQLLVRFLGKIGKIVSRILENFSQVPIIYALFANKFG